MAKYDSPGFDSPLPGFGGGFDRAGAPPGTEGGGHGPISPQGVAADMLTGLPGSGAVVSIMNSDGGANAGPTSDVLPGVRKEMARNSYTGVTGADDSGAGEGGAGHFRHPNSNGVNHA